MVVLASSFHGRVAIGAVLLTFTGCEAPELAVAVEVLPDRHTLPGTILATTMLHTRTLQ
jgi:hypothetical protein